MRLPILAAALSASLTSSLALGAEPPTRPAELRELDRLVGTWKVAEFVSKKGEWTPKEVRTSGDVATFKWIMDGWFLEERAIPAGGADHLGIWHYDQADKVFRCAFYQAPGGNRTDFTHRWDARAQVFNGTCAMPNGVTMRSAIRFPDKNTKVWTAVATDAAGKVYLDMTCKEVRAETAQLDRQAPEGAYVDDAATSLQGFWRANSVEAEGKPAPAEALKQTWFSVEGNKLVFKIDGPQVECGFKTDAKQSPKQLTLAVTKSDQRKVNDAKEIFAIYELTGDDLKICLSSSHPTAKRPTEFAAQEKSGRMLIVLKRQKR